MQLLTDRRVVKFHKLDPFRGRTRALPYRSDNPGCFLPHESCGLESSYAGSAKIFRMIPESDFINASDVLPPRMFAALTPAGNGTINLPALRLMRSSCPNIRPLDLEDHPHLASASVPEIGKRLFFMSDLCHAGPFAFGRELPADADVSSTIPSDANRFPIVPMMSPTGRF